MLVISELVKSSIDLSTLMTKKILKNVLPDVLKDIYFLFYTSLKFSNSCGEEGIRTPETVSRLHAFQACALSHSATSPYVSSFKSNSLLQL